MKYIMSDGRAFTNFSTDCTINSQLQKKYNITDLNSYRAFLQHNSEKVKADLFAPQAETKVCPVCKEALNYKP